MQDTTTDLRVNWPVRQKTSLLESEGRLRHVILASQFDRERIDDLCQVAEQVREIAEAPKGREELAKLLPHLNVLLYFTQPSTRTFLSFSAAARLLGMGVEHARDAEMSSEAKGESDFDSVRMFASYFDAIVMRSPKADLAERCAYMMNDLADAKQNQRSVPIINAGSGKDQHPTQSLLDILTIKRTFSRTHYEELRAADPKHAFSVSQLDVGNKRYAFCGDVGRGRTIRSLAELLSNYENVSMCFIAPDHPKLQLSDDMRDLLLKRGVEVEEYATLDAKVGKKWLLSTVDCLYMTRVQSEHDDDDLKTFLKTADISGCHLTLPRVHRMKPYAPILHPFPRDSRVMEIPTEVDSDPRAMYFRQARNGLWARAGLLAHIFGKDKKLADIHADFFRERHDYNR